jgi:pyruvate ferredoxin oxidoreductase beta subunit
MNTNKPKKFLNPGHSACAGCGEMVVLRAVMRGLDENTILTNATGCSEVTTTPYPTSAFGLPWIHSLFENCSAVASGIRAVLEHQKKLNPNQNIPDIKVVAIGGDGATFDIGLGLISGAWEREDRFLYICLDTEAYSNTGIQSSGATPYGADTTTTPVGLNTPGSTGVKKDMLGIALAHGLKYVAQTTSGFPDDITAKVKKALSVDGPSYIQILSPCVFGWKAAYDQAVNIGKLAAQTGLYPVLEYENDVLVNKMKVPAATPKVEDYLKTQGRFSHLFKGDKYKDTISHIQELAEKNIIKYGLR